MERPPNTKSVSFDDLHIVSIEKQQDVLENHFFSDDKTIGEIDYGDNELDELEMEYEKLSSKE